MVLAIFTRCLVPEICIFLHFWVKSVFLGLNSSWTKEITAKPMGPKRGLKMAKFHKKKFHRFSGSKLPQKMVLAVFTRCLVPEIRIFSHFWLKPAFLGLNSSWTKEITAKPMVLSYVGHFYKHWKKKSLERFFLKGKKTLFFTRFTPFSLNLDPF